MKQIIICISLFVAFGANAQEIESKIACEWAPLNLDCKRGEILTIVAANYGRTSSAICVHHGHTNCRAQSSLDRVKSNCDGRSSCTVLANNHVFGDPCAGVEKYLEVQYKCTLAPPCGGTQYKCDDGRCVKKTAVCDGNLDCSGGEDEMGCSYRTAHGCEGSTLNVECKRGELIRVLTGNYGKTNAALCEWNANTNCKSPVAANILKDRCDLRRGCSVPATNGVFGDPCIGVKKYAEIKYICWQIPLNNAEFPPST